MSLEISYKMRPQQLQVSDMFNTHVATAILSWFRAMLADESHFYKPNCANELHGANTYIAILSHHLLKFGTAQNH